jgi:hypothetical protein
MSQVGATEEEEEEEEEKKKGTIEFDVLCPI